MTSRRVQDRNPPHDLEAEASVLGALLLDAAAIARVDDMLEPEDFYRENNGQIYRAARALRCAGKPIDIITLAGELEKMGVLERVGGRAHLAMLQEQTPTAGNVTHYARRVKGKAAKRHLISASGEIEALGYEDSLDAGEAIEQARRKIAGLPDLTGDGTLTVIRLSEVASERVEWLWWRRLPLGKVVILDGDPGLGKSTVTLDLAARVSTGREMPDGGSGIPGGAGVVVLSNEDGLGDTIRPRLEVAGADLERVVTFKVFDEDRTERMPELPRDIPAIERVIGDFGARLVIIDPLMAYLAGEVNTHRDQDVRRALTPVADVAERTGATVIVVRHLNKAPGGNPIYRGGGSIGIIGAARVGLLVAEHPEDASLRVLAPIKTNLSTPPPSLTYRLVEADGDIARVEWQGTSEVTAAQLLVVSHADSAEERTAVGEAELFLRGLLADGPVPSKQALREAREAGIAEKTLNRARKALGVRAEKQGMRGGWVWSLPEDGHDLATFEDGQHSPKTANSQGWPSSASSDHLRGGGAIPEAIA